MPQPDVSWGWGPIVEGPVSCRTLLSLTWIRSKRFWLRAIVMDKSWVSELNQRWSDVGAPGEVPHTISCISYASVVAGKRTEQLNITHTQQCTNAGCYHTIGNYPTKAKTSEGHIKSKQGMPKRFCKCPEYSGLNNRNVSREPASIVQLTAQLPMIHWLDLSQ